MVARITPSGNERFFDDDEIIVSKTDTKGRITYANDVFLRISSFKEKEVLGMPHALIRHPEMPRCIFKLLWDTIQAKEEIFAYVVNLAKNGDHYWVLAHVTPTLDKDGNITNFHSNRRVPDRTILEGTIIPFYKKLLDEEARHSNAKDGMNSAYKMLTSMLEEKSKAYDEFIFSLTAGDAQ